MRDIVFKDRKEAGQILARHLEKYRANEKTLVMGVPKGGVEVGFQVAMYLHLSFCTAIAKKLAFPTNKEFGFGALAEDGSLYVPANSKRFLGAELLEQVIESQKKEIQRRVDLYREGHLLPDLDGRTIIIIDDGIDTGVTLVPLLHLCQKKGAEKIVIASPIANLRYDWRLDDADELVFVQKPSTFSKVSDYYRDFSEVSDQRVKDLLKLGNCALKPS